MFRSRNDSVRDSQCGGDFFPKPQTSRATDGCTIKTCLICMGTHRLPSVMSVPSLLLGPCMLRHARRNQLIAREDLKQFKRHVKVLWNTQEICSVNVLARRWECGAIKADGVIAAGVAAFNFSFIHRPCEAVIKNRHPFFWIHSRSSRAPSESFRAWKSWQLVFRSALCT